MMIYFDEWFEDFPEPTPKQRRRYKRGGHRGRISVEIKPVRGERTYRADLKLRDFSKAEPCAE